MEDAVPAEWIAAPAEELCLDFANTRFWRGLPAPTESLPDFAALAAWCAEKAGLPAAEGESLKRWAARDPEKAAAALAEALSLREAIYRLLRAASGKAPPAPADLARFNRALGETAERRKLENLPAGFGWRVGAAPGALRLLTPVLWSAADLLVGRRLAKLRQCANPQCQWLFLDDSKSGNRRWCSMSACGNRAKAHRHYLRKKQA